MLCIAQLNYERYQEWDLNSDQVNAAIYMFQGDVYQGLKAEAFSANEIDCFSCPTKLSDNIQQYLLDIFYGHITQN